MKTLFISACFLASLQLISQESALQIVKESVNRDALNEFILKEKSVNERNFKKLRTLNLDAVFVRDGITYSFDYFDENQEPVYTATCSRIGSLTLNVDAINSSEHKNYNINGSTLIPIRVWDSATWEEHPDFGDRVNYVDNNILSGTHGTEVSGCIASGGIDDHARGILTQANIIAYQAGQDREEMAEEILDGMILSNHSYGWFHPVKYALPPAGSAYSARLFDELYFSAPHYVATWAMGNESHSFRRPAMVKNNFVVSNCVPFPNGYFNNSSIKLDNSSSFGPITDLLGDGYRLKPEVCAPGRIYTTTFNDSENPIPSYTGINGTSFSAPHVTGALGVMQEFYESIHQEYLLASELKALACHTANDGGLEGPDVKFGYGAVNVLKAVEFIENDGCGSYSISNDVLIEGQENIHPVNISGSTFRATIAWIDPPKGGEIEEEGYIYDGFSLTNDVDIILKNTNTAEEYFPYLLDPIDPENNLALQGNNNADNIIQVYAENLTPVTRPYCC